MKRFLETLKEKITAYDIFIILISAIVSSAFSLLGGLNVEISICICIVIISIFLIAAILIQGLCDRFDVLRLMKEFNRNKQYNLTIALGTNLSEGLWHTYKLKLRIKIGKQIKKAADESLPSASLSKSVEFKYISAKTLIDDLGYTNYILNNINEAYNNIQEGIKIIDELLQVNAITSDELRLKELKLKALRHQMGMLESISHFIGGENKVDNIRKDFQSLLSELTSTHNMNDAYDIIKKEFVKDSSELDKEKVQEEIKKLLNYDSDAVLCAKYAEIKDYFLKEKKDNNKDAVKNALTQLLNLSEKIDKIKDKKRCEDWQFKCNRLKWEIQLFLDCDIDNNYEELLNAIQHPENKTINRFLDTYKRYLLYLDHKIKQDEDLENRLKDYERDWKQAKKIESKFLLHCEAKKTMREIKKLNKSIKSYLKIKKQR